MKTKEEITRDAAEKFYDKSGYCHSGHRYIANIETIECVILSAINEATKGLKSEIAILRNENKRDGNWLDKWGACKVCDGEIPHGHTHGCDIFKLEQEVSRLKEELKKWKEANQANYDDARDCHLKSDKRRLEIIELQSQLNTAREALEIVQTASFRALEDHQKDIKHLIELPMSSIEYQKLKQALSQLSKQD